MKPNNKRKLKLSTETLRLLSADQLARVDGGQLVTEPTHVGSCNGQSCGGATGCAGTC